MGIARFGGKLLVTHAIMSIVQLALMPAMFGIWENEVFQWIMGLLYIGIFWLVIYADSSAQGVDDLKRETYIRYKGFVSGLIASIPAAVLYIAALFYENFSKQINWFETALRLWLVPYIKIFSSFENSMPYIAGIPVLIFPLLTGFSYLDGKRKRKKILESIKKADLQRAEKSKVKSK